MMIFNSLKTAVLAVFLCLAALLGGCSTINTLGDFVSENPMFASAASRQAVAAFISEGATDEERTLNAKRVNATVGKALAFLEGNPTATVDDLLNNVIQEIDWSTLTVTEQFLVRDIIALVEDELRKYEVRTGLIPESTKIAVRGLLKTAQNAAIVYLAK